MGVNILVAHGGGPTAVINTSLQGVVVAARASGKVDKIYAARFGAEGILKGDLIDLTQVPAGTIAKLAHTPASAIGSCRRKLTDADYPTVIETLKNSTLAASSITAATTPWTPVTRSASWLRQRGWI